MFSTGPMFVSIIYALYTSHNSRDIRILPKALYGKNAKDGEAPHSFFYHLYGSSWHAEDAGFIAFLRDKGKILMWIGLFILVAGVCKILLTQGRRRKYLGRMGRYEVLLPRWSHHTGSWQLGWSSVSPGSRREHQAFSSESSDGDEDGLVLPFDIGSPTSSEAPEHGFRYNEQSSSRNLVSSAVQNLRNRITSITGAQLETPRTPIHSRRRSRGVLFFLPAIFHQPAEPIPLESRPFLPTSTEHTERSVPTLQRPPEKRRSQVDLQNAISSSMEPRARSPRPLLDMEDGSPKHDLLS